MYVDTLSRSEETIPSGTGTSCHWETALSSSSSCNFPGYTKTKTKTLKHFLNFILYITPYSCLFIFHSFENLETSSSTFLLHHLDHLPFLACLIFFVLFLFFLVQFQLWNQLFGLIRLLTSASILSISPTKLWWGYWIIVS